MATDRTEFDAQRAKAWKMEVDAEFAAVKVLLKKVTEECTKDPIGDDTILKAVDSAGQYYGLVTLRKLISESEDRNGQIVRDVREKK